MKNNVWQQYDATTEGTKLIADRVIRDKGKNGEPIGFIIPDIPRLMSLKLRIGDEVFIPVNTRHGAITFWELGGNNPSASSSFATIVTSDADQLMNAMLFSKINKSPNGKHALMVVKPGFKLYIGKIVVRRNVLAPKLRILRLVFQGASSEFTGVRSDTLYGRFIVHDIFTEYREVVGIQPAERLVDKLFEKNVKKPYFANGWSISNIASIRNKIDLNTSYERLISELNEPTKFIVANKFLDHVENKIIGLNNRNLSAVFQFMDFANDRLIIAPLLDMTLSDIAGTIDKSHTTSSSEIPLLNMTNCYNQNILFNSTDITMLEKALQHEEKYAVQIGERSFVVIRGWRG